MRKYKIIALSLITAGFIGIALADEKKDIQDKKVNVSQKQQNEKQPKKDISKETKKANETKSQKGNPKKQEGKAKTEKKIDKKKAEKLRKKLLLQIMGLYRDKIYSLAYKKAKEYLTKYPNDKKNKKELIKIMLTSAIKLKKDKYILDMIDFVNQFPDLSESFKEKVYGTIIKYYAKNPKKLKLALEKTLNYVKNPKLKKKFAEALVDLYFKDRQYHKIVNMKYIPYNSYYLKIIALYKLEKYEDVIKETENLGKFPPEERDKVLYYRALAFYKLGDLDKAVQLFEKMKDKNPEILKIIVSYYLKKEDFDKVRKYLYQLSKYPDYYDLAYYLLGYLEDREGNFDKAFQYYSIAAKYPSKYGRFAKKRIKQFLASDLLDVYYSIRLGVFSNKKYAKNFLRRLKKENCFTKDYKDFVAVYCGKFKSFKSAQAKLDLWLARGFEDAIIEKLADFKGLN